MIVILRRARTEDPANQPAEETSSKKAHAHWRLDISRTPELGQTLLARKSET
jgi:hypothetical protein